MLKNIEKTTIRRTHGDIIFDIINYTVLTLVLLCVLYPLYFVVIASVSEPLAVQNGEVGLLPVRFTLEGYIKIFQYRSIWTGYANTIFYVLVSTTISVMATMLTAYPISRRRFFGRNFVLFFLMFTMYFSGGMIPLYLQVKKLGLVDSYWSVILVNAINVFNVIIARTFIQSSIPEDLHEAASIDGCNHFMFFATMVMPLSKALLAILALYYGIAMWNDYFNAMLYITDFSKYPLQLILKSILTQNEVSTDMLAGSTFEDFAAMQRMVDLMRYGLIIVSSLPVLAIYPFLQKYFVKGMMIGSVKG